MQVHSVLPPDPETDLVWYSGTLRMLGFALHTVPCIPMLHCTKGTGSYGLVCCVAVISFSGTGEIIYPGAFFACANVGNGTARVDETAVEVKGRALSLAVTL